MRATDQKFGSQAEGWRLAFAGKGVEQLVARRMNFTRANQRPHVHCAPPSCPDTLEIITRRGKTQGESLLRFSRMQSETRRVVVVAYLPREILRLRCYEVNLKLQGVAMVSPCSTTGDEVFLCSFSRFNCETPVLRVHHGSAEFQFALYVRLREITSGRIRGFLGEV